MALQPLVVRQVRRPQAAHPVSRRQQAHVEGQLAQGVRSRAEGDKRTERPRPRRWRGLACPVEWQGAGRTGTEAEGGRPVLGGDFLHHFSLPNAPRFRRGHTLKAASIL
jgi:hypothetical protein